MALITYGSASDFDALVYGPKHPGTIRFLENQMARVEQFSHFLGNAGQQFKDSARQLYDRFSSSEAMRLARVAARKANSLFQRDVIQAMDDRGRMQNAPLTMQRWIMAEETVRRMYQHQRCDGYSGTYVDMHPGDIGKDHYDHRRVMEGMVVLVDDNPDDDGSPGWKATFHFDELLPNDRELTLDEKVDIMSTWDFIRAFMDEGGEDPTSPYGSKL